jgi:hypothetical protein
MSIARTTGSRACIAGLALICVAASAAEPSDCAGRFSDPPKELRFEVNSERSGSGERLIRIEAEFESVFRCRIGDIIRTLWDFEGMPKVFGRVEAVRVRAMGPEYAITEQRTAIRVLGFSYVSNLVFENRIARIGDESALMSFETIEVDRTTRSSGGSWYLEERSDPSGTSTLVRYSIDSLVVSGFAAQELVMRRFGEKDVANVVEELAAAVARRARSGA